MKKSWRLLFVLAILGCGEKGLEQQISGRWFMESVTIAGEDRSSDLNPAGNRWLSFEANGQFSSGSAALQENAGTYQLDPKTSLLQMDSDAGPGDDSNWTIEVAEDTLIMRGVGTARQEASVVRLVREKGK